MTSLRIGVIAEDETDVDTLRILIRRLCKQAVAVRGRAGGGGGEILRKGDRYMNALVKEGCQRLILVRDLDRDARDQLNDQDELRRKLEAIPVPAGVLRHICIPVEEIEAWFWADEEVLKKVGRGAASKAHASPESLRHPKEALMRLSRDGGGKPRYATNENSKLDRIPLDPIPGPVIKGPT